MIRRTPKSIVGNEARARQLWKVVASGIFPPSRRNDDVHRQFVSSLFGHHTVREASQQDHELVFVQTAGSDTLITSGRLKDVTEYSFRKDWITGQAGITRRRDHRYWIGSTTSSSVVTYLGAECSKSGWSTGNPGRSQNQRGSLLASWNRRVTTRVLSTKSKEGDDITHSSSPDEEITLTKEEVLTRPKTIDDFQHEEIVGPTVERDLSDTANELRASLDQLIGVMSRLKTGFVLLGSVQVVAALYSLYFHGVKLIPGLSQDLTFVMSFILAYLLRLFGSRLEFFSKIEGRSRMRVLTLSLMVNKMLTTFFSRSSFVVKSVAVFSILALLSNVWHSLNL